MNIYKKYQDELTYPQKTALEGEIAYAVATSNHDEDIVYKMYAILSTVPKEYYLFVLGSFHEMCELPDEIYTRIRNELTYGEVPLWIWKNKCIADLTESMKLSAQASANLSANMYTIKKKILESAFVLFCRKTSIILKEPIIELCQEILENNKLDFLYSACTFLIQELSELPKRKASRKLLQEVMTCTIDIRDILSFSIEYETLKPKNKGKIKSKPSKKEGNVLKEVFEFSCDDFKTSEEIQEEIQKKTQEIFNSLLILPISKKEKKKTTFIVKKYFNGSKSGTALKTFSTKQEAENFIKDILEKFPDLKNTCTFVIEHGILNN